MSDGRKKRLWRVILVICCAVAAVAAALLAALWLPRLWAHEVPMPSSSSAPVSAPESSEPAPLVENPIDFAALQEKNPETHAWIRIPGTVIDYPVMQSGPDTAEDFYLHHGTDRKYLFAGSIYVQRYNTADFSDPNTVLYGHNMKNGSMFAALHKFEKQEFFDAHEEMYIYTPGHILTYRIYSAFVYDDRHILLSFDFSNPEEYGLFLSETLAPMSMKRQVRQGISVTTADRIVTLSTCTNRKNERYLVEGVLVSDQRTY